MVSLDIGVYSTSTQISKSFPPSTCKIDLLLKTAFRQISNQRSKKLENTTRSGVFSSNFEVFGNLARHCFDSVLFEILRIAAKAVT